MWEGGEEGKGGAAKTPWAFTKLLRVVATSTWSLPKCSFLILSARWSISRLVHLHTVLSGGPSRSFHAECCASVGNLIRILPGVCRPTLRRACHTKVSDHVTERHGLGARLKSFLYSGARMAEQADHVHKAKNGWNEHRGATFLTSFGDVSSRFHQACGGAPSHLEAACNTMATADGRSRVRASNLRSTSAIRFLRI